MSITDVRPVTVVTVPTAVLRSALDTVHAFTGRAHVPLLGAVVLRGDGATVELRAFDYETSARIPLGDTSEVFDVAVDRAMLREIVKGHDRKGFTSLEIGERVTVSQGNARASLATLAVADYPELPVVDVDPLAIVDATVLAAAVKRAVLAAGRDDYLPILNAVAFTFSADGIELAATDRFRLTVESVPAVVASEANGTRVLLPAKLAGLLTRKITGDVSIAAVGTSPESAYVVLATSAGVFTVRTVYGEFPRYAGLFPVVEFAAEFDVKAMAGALKRVAVAAERNTVRFTFAGDAVTLRAGTEDSEAAESVPLLRAVPDEHTVGFNPRFLSDVLASATAATVVMGYTQPARPHVFHAPGDETFRNLLMPVRFPS